MPTVLRVGPYRFFFYSRDLEERVHIHVESADGTAKLWLDAPSFASVHGLSPIQQREILRLVTEHVDFLKQKWGERLGHTNS